MASRTGLMPMKARTEVKTKWTSTIAARKSLQTSKAAPSGKTESLSNMRKKPENKKPLPKYKQEMVSKKAGGTMASKKVGGSVISKKVDGSVTSKKVGVSAVTSMTSIVPKNILPAANKPLTKPTLPTKNNSSMRKSYPGFSSADRPKHTSSNRKSFMPGQRTPKSILKKEPWAPDTEKKSAQAFKCSDSNHVKFRSKATDQANLRSKLDSWLESKGKAPSIRHCRHHMCFDTEVSAQKRDVLVDRNLNNSSLSRQMKSKEPVKKKLFNDDRKSLLNTDKENTVQDMKVCCEHSADTVDNSVKLVTEEPGQAKAQQPLEDPSDVSSGSGSSFQNVKKEDVRTKIESMLEEYLHLFNSGCPLENILPWFHEMERNMPEMLTFATYYVCKAKVVANFPKMVLDVFCEAVQNNAQPSQLLAVEMKNYFSKRLSSVNSSNKTEINFAQIQSPSSIQDVSDIKSLQNKDTVQVSSSSSDCIIVSNKQDPSVSDLGSTIKYSVGSVKSFLSDNTQAYVTPVRRSFRLSGKPPTPGSALRRELNSVSELSELECQSMLFKVNKAYAID